MEDGKTVVHMLHIGKTGGTALKHALAAHPSTEHYSIDGIQVADVQDRDLAAHPSTEHYSIVLHGHPTRLREVPEGEKVFFFLRNPVMRFVSAYYSKQREGRPLRVNPSTPEQLAVFERFPSPNALARALSSEGEERALAHRAMEIMPVFHSILYYFESEEYLLSRLPDLFYIGFQEQLSEDFERLKEKLGLPADLRLPDDWVAAHKHPAHLDYRLDDMAIASLQAWYEADQRLVHLCRSHAPEVNARRHLTSS